MRRSPPPTPMMDHLIPHCKVAGSYDRAVAIEAVGRLAPGLIRQGNVGLLFCKKRNSTTSITNNFCKSKLDMIESVQTLCFCGKNVKGCGKKYRSGLHYREQNNCDSTS